MSQQPAPQGKPVPAADPADPANPANPAAKTAGRSPSPLTRLRIARTLAALACLIAGLVGYFVLSATATSLNSISDGTQQSLRIQQIKGGILRADGLAANGLAQGASEPITQRQAYRQALQDAAKATVEASQAQPLDSTNLALANAALVNYSATLEYARTSYLADPKVGAQYVTEAGDILHNDIVPALDKLVADNDARVAAAKASDRMWTIGLAIVLVVILLGISVWLGRATKRVVNIGLVVALALSVVMWRIVDPSLTSAQSVVDSARNGSLRTASAASNAYAQLAEAKSAEGRGLLLSSQLTTLEAGWTTSMAAVDASVGKLDAAAATKVKDQVAAYKAAHKVIADLLAQNRVTDARATAASTAVGVNPTYQAASESLSGVFSDAAKETADEMAKQRDNLYLASGALALLGVLAAVAAAWGITQRVREYR